MPRLARYRLPIGINPSLRNYERSWLGSDLGAGITVGALTIPSALGYAEGDELASSCLMPMEELCREVERKPLAGGPLFRNG